MAALDLRQHFESLSPLELWQFKEIFQEIGLLQSDIQEVLHQSNAMKDGIFATWEWYGFYRLLITLCFLYIYIYIHEDIYIYIIIFNIYIHGIYEHIYIYIYIHIMYDKQDLSICVYTSIITSVSRHQKISSQVSQPSRLVILRPNGSYIFPF